MLNNGSSRSRIGRILLLLASIGPAVTPFHAQVSSSKPLEERTGVALRLLDVVVTDKDGRPMLNLQPEDFLVKVDGKERRIRTLDSATSVPTVEPIQLADGTVVHRRELPVRPARWVVIFLDAVRTPPNYRKTVLETARSIVENSGAPGDRFAVALLRGQELRFLQEFAPADEIDLSIFDDADMLLTTSYDMKHRLDEMTELVMACKGLNTQDSCIITRTEEFVGVLRGEAVAGVQAMRSMVSAMSPLPGRKALIWFSNGMVLQPGELVLEAVTRYVGEPSSIISQLSDRGNAGLDLMISEATRAGVSIFGLRAGSDTGNDMRGADKASVDRQLAGFGANPYKLSTTVTQESMRDTADATGGKVVFTPLNGKTAFGLLDQLDGVYTIGIGVERQDSYRSKVKVRLRSKKGKIQLQGRLTQRFPPTLPIEAKLDPDGPSLVWFTVNLENLATEKLGQFAPERSRIAVYGHVRTADGRIESPFYRIFELARDPEAPLEFREALNFAEPAGKHLIEVFVSDLIGGAQTAVSAIRGETPTVGDSTAKPEGSRP